MAVPIQLPLASTAFVLGVVMILIGLAVGFPLWGKDHWSVQEQFDDWKPLIGILISVFTLPVGIAAFLVGVVNTTKNKKLTQNTRGAIVGLISILFFGASILSTVYFIEPTVEVVGVDRGQCDLLTRYMGVMLTTVTTPLAFVFAIVSFQLFFSKRAKAPFVAVNVDDSSEVNILRSKETHGLALLGFLFVFPLVIVCSMIFPPIWNLTFVGDGSYWEFVSPYSLFYGEENLTYLKLYIDVVMFFGFIFIVAITVVIVSRIKALGPHLNVEWRKGISLGVRISYHITLGEVLFWITFSGLCAWWGWWWIYGYGRINQMEDYPERFARGMGHFTNLFMSLLLFPVTRNSIWVNLLGIPFDRAIAYHRVLGTLTIMSVTMHMISWYIEWGHLGCLGFNIYSIQFTQHPDNWTIPMMEIVWLLLFIMGVFSLPFVRRKNFELFYYSHHLFVVVFICALIHAWSLWYFLSGPLLLWFIDRIVRHYRSCQPFEIAELNNWAGLITVLVANSGKRFSFKAGQYCFVNIPEIGALEWHPFSISSAPVDNTLSFHILSMGKNSWTAKLNSLARTNLSYKNMNRPFNLVVNIDGPYGLPPDFSKAGFVILVAGGIGITPVHSQIKDLFELTTQNHPDVINIKRIYLIWVARDERIFTIFRPTIENILSQPNGKFFVSLHTTGSKVSADFSLSTEVDRPSPEDVEQGPLFNVLPGRPNFDVLFSQIALEANKAGLRQHGMLNVSVSVCGPQLMIEDVVRASNAARFEVHHETFEL